MCWMHRYVICTDPDIEIQRMTLTFLPHMFQSLGLEALNHPSCAKVPLRYRNPHH